MSLSSCLYVGQVYHKRYRPREHVLRYSVFSLLVDLDEIDQLVKELWLFSHNRFNLFGFHDGDFGERCDEPLSDYVNRKLVESGIHKMPTQILLSCYPRVLGFVFNPLSLFYCLDKQGRCFAIVHEVHNTFGERHAYVLPVVDSTKTAEFLPPARQTDETAEFLPEQNRDGIDNWIHQQADKQLFVSPFAHMGMRYQFRLNLPEKKQVVVIRASDEKGLLITASYTAVRHGLSSSALAQFFFKIPLLTIKVISAIHWEALRLWIKGVPLFKHQPKRSG